MAHGSAWPAQSDRTTSPHRPGRHGTRLPNPGNEDKSAMRVRLKVVEGKPHGAVIALHGKWFYIGRDATCQLRPKNDAVGERHCALFLDGDYVEVKDLGTRAGTLLNGRRLKPSISTPVHNGD